MTTIMFISTEHIKYFFELLGHVPTFSQSAMTMTEGSVMVLSSSLVALFFSSL